MSLICSWTWSIKLVFFLFHVAVKTCCTCSRPLHVVIYASVSITIFIQMLVKFKVCHSWYIFWIKLQCLFMYWMEFKQLFTNSLHCACFYGGGAENAVVENAGVDKVWKAVRIKYSVDSVWLPQYPRVRTNNFGHTPTGSAKCRR